MSLFTTRMKLLSAVVIETKAEAVAKELLKLGLLDFVDITKLFNTEGFELSTGDKSLYSEAQELRRKLETIYNQAGVEYPFREKLSLSQMSGFHGEKTRAEIDKTVSELQQLRDKQKKSWQEYLKLKEISDYLQTGSGRTSGDSKFLLVNRGRPSKGNFESLLESISQIPHFGTSITGSDLCFLVTLRRDRSTVENALEKFSWIENDDQAAVAGRDSKVLERLHEKSELIKSQTDKISEEMKNRVLENKERLDGIWKNLRLHELYGTIRNNFSHTQSTSLFSGWLPANKAAVAESAIRSACNGECIIEWSEAKEFRRETVPVEIKQPKALAPFKMLVENFAVPEYGSIDPTIFVTVAYMIMFGLMFGDAGQGLVIILIGLIGGRLMSKSSPGIKNLMHLFIYCGSASVVTGILFGSYFGYKIFPPLWFDYHGIVLGHGDGAGGNIHDVYDILRITIYFGISVIAAGLLINWINLYKKRDFFTLLLDKSGVLGGWFYGCGIYTSFYFVKTGYKLLPDGNLLFFFFGIPVVILFFKAPLHFFLHERNHKEFTPFSLIDFFMEWVVEILEIFSGYLANTLSFMRVAGLGIAHVSLMTAFDTIAGMTSGVSSILILVVGNILVIALEGLSAGIQALRLNYYEFFSRYFTGKGIAYNPVSLRNRKQEG